MILLNKTYKQVQDNKVKLVFRSVPRRAERLDKTDLIILTDVFASQGVIEKIQRAEIKFMTAKDMLKLALKN